MVAANSSVRIGNDAETYVFDVAQLKDHIAASCSNGTWACYDKTTLRESFKVPKAHSNITGIINYEKHNGVLTCGTDGKLQLWDIRDSSSKPARTWTSQSVPFTCLAANQTEQIAAGSELTRSLASIFLLDARNEQKIIRQWNDAHNDDITSLQFHPKDNNLLLSGSVDGLVNLMDITKDEDTENTDEDPLLHVINHDASIHIARFLGKRRVLALSHMESYALYKLKRDSDDKTWTSKEVTSNQDLRQSLPCSYVIDAFPGNDKRSCMLAFGSFSSNETQLASLDADTGEINKEDIVFERMSTEICRAITYDSKNHVYYTGGEDGMLQCFAV
ncbi:WD repeat protein, WDR89 family [Schizosaccharomyces osmophilus]|uniref:WD repeat protein, WDR89 family n=1 Tax=Schizosaccharomyces osmophilus TaxID=2545709 RepID=A0AAE9WH89_9SCHI|nr:WD repeat protein, WDR89 family [Schizosaccharomyces osmophilus]WBW74982.1 WD repeat protein, WDR89 family [Schizosaccharomyces osmophilus]